MRPRLIFHCDCNNFYASCECLERPELKNVPMAVAGDPKYRTGVVVAKNELAKKAGVKTTDTVWQAQRKCPGIVFVPPRHGLYRQISQRVNDIYHEYTDYLEPASIDESYLDMTGAPEYYGLTPVELADTLQARHTADLIAQGVPEKEAKRRAEKMAIEDARYVLPNACETKMVVTMNARSLYNFFQLRCCNRAQWEIRELAWAMLKLCREAAPTLFKKAGPACLGGACPEGTMTCGLAKEVRERSANL
jgi:hypothetical protein